MATVALAGTDATGWSARSLRVTGSVAFAVAVIALMQTSSIALLAALPVAFDTDIAAVSWVATSTLVVGAAVNPVVGRMGDMYGKRTLLLVCLGAALAGSVLAAVAGSLLVVIAGRAVQGIGSGVIPLSYGIVRDELPPRHLSRAVAVVTAAGAGLGAGLGPVVMGSVLSAHGWQSVFWVTGGLCVLALVAVLASTRGAATRFPARFDLPGAVVLASTLFVLLLGIANGSSWGWTSPRVLGLVAATAALTWWWVRWERSRAEPLVDLAVSSSGPVLVAHLAGVMVGFATFAQYISSFALVTLPASTGFGLGQSVGVAGLVQLPGAFVLFAAVMLGTRISATRGSYALLRTGAALIVAGFALAFVRHDSILDVVLSAAVVNAGLGLAFCALPILIMDNVHHSQTAAVNALNALARVVGSVLASAIVTAVMATGATVVAGRELPAEWTFLAAYVIGSVPAVAVGTLAWRAQRRGGERPLP
jgi:MFS family permease